MSTSSPLFTHTTWRNIGLGLTTTIFALGAMSMIAPSVAAGPLGVLPLTAEGREFADKGMMFLGIRDVAAAAALFWYYKEGKVREMGVLLSSWALVSVVDTWIAAQGPRGWDGGVWTLCGATLVIAFGGFGCYKSTH